MRTKNARAIDADESAWLADVKSVGCVFCDAPPVSEAHHPKQGRHFCTVASCKACHDARVWRIGGMSEFDAINETIRRVNCLRAGKVQQSAPSMRKQRVVSRERSALSSSKILPRRIAA